MTTRGPGRPTKLTPATQAKILESIRAGLTHKLACMRVGVNDSTFYRWLQEGSQARSGRYKDFHDEVMRANADSAEVLLNQIRIKAYEDWRAAAFILERRFPDDYGKRTELTGKDGGPVIVETAEDAALLAKLRKMTGADQEPEP